MFALSQRQSLTNLVTDRENTRRCKKSWMKELKYKVEDTQYPVMILGRFVPHNIYIISIYNRGRYASINF